MLLFLVRATICIIFFHRIDNSLNLRAKTRTYHKSALSLRVFLLYRLYKMDNLSCGLLQIRKLTGRGIYAAAVTIIIILVAVIGSAAVTEQIFKFPWRNRGTALKCRCAIFNGFLVCAEVMANLFEKF